MSENWGWLFTGYLLLDGNPGEVRVLELRVDGLAKIRKTFSPNSGADKRMPTIVNLLCRVMILVILGTGFFLDPASAGFDIRREKIIGTHYTGSTWAPAFWSNVNIYEVHDDFLEIKENGFNTVIIVVPWVGFQTSVEPITYFEDYFQLLDKIFRIARKSALNVILRIGYVHEIGTTSVPGHYERVINLFTEKNIHSAWLDYLDRLYETASKYDNFLFGFVTWEDFFLIDFTHLPVEKRTSLSARIGYQEYLTRYSLTSLSEIYKKMFSSYTEIPIPGYNSSAVPLFYEFWDQLLMTIYKESKKHFLKLSMEVRVDCDPSHGSTRYNCHESTFDLGGEGDITIIYYTPAWGASNKGDQATADDAVSRFQHLLDLVRSNTDNLIFIDQFNFVDNTPGFKKNTKIIPDDTPDFIDRSAEVISDNTIGYALWAMKDVRANVIKNGSFERGNLGWDTEKGRLLTGEGEIQRSLLLEDMGHLEQYIGGGCVATLFELMKKKGGAYYSLRFEAKKKGLKPSELHIKMTDKDGQIFYQSNSAISSDLAKIITLSKIPLFNDAVITIVNSGADVVFDDFELFCYVQENGVYDVFGAPKHFRDNIVALNQSLRSERKSVLEYYDKKALQMVAIEGLHHDGWANEVVFGEIMVPLDVNRKSFIVEAYVPDTWHTYSNKITLKINNMVIGSSCIKPAYNKILFTVDTESTKGKILPFSIVSEKVYSPSAFDPASLDKRMVSFVLISVGFAK